LSGPRSGPITSQKIWESNPGHWICSQELWPLDHGSSQREEEEEEEEEDDDDDDDDDEIYKNKGNI
jgi:hypothetical protein